MKLFPIDDVDERFMDLIGEKVRTESNCLCISTNCPSQAEICVDFLVSNALPGLDAFLVQAYYDIHCSDEIWERIKDVIPKYDEIEVAQVNIVSYSTLANLTRQTC